MDEDKVWAVSAAILVTLCGLFGSFSLRIFADYLNWNPRPVGVPIKTGLLCGASVGLVAAYHAYYAKSLRRVLLTLWLSVCAAGLGCAYMVIAAYG